MCVCSRAHACTVSLYRVSGTMHVHICTYLCVCVYKPRDHVGCLHKLLPQQALSMAQSSSSRLSCQAIDLGVLHISSLPPHRDGITECATTPGFLCGFQSSKLHSCSASILPENSAAPARLLQPSPASPYKLYPQAGEQFFYLFTIIGVFVFVCLFGSCF